MGSEDNFTNIYINNLDNSIDDVTLRQICEQICGVGTVKTLVVFKARNEHSMGYGFCNFINHQCALKAIKYMNSMILCSKKISAARATPKNDRDQYKRSLSQLSQAPELNANVYIKNFDSFVNEEILRSAFSRFGTIINVRIMRNLSGFSKGFGFVSFLSHDDALRAIREMNGSTLAGRTITVDFYTPKNSRKSLDKDSNPSQSTQIPSGSASASTTASVPSSIFVPTSFSASSEEDEEDREEEEEEEEERKGNDESSPELFIPLYHPENEFSEYGTQEINDVIDNVNYVIDDDVNQGFLSEDSNNYDDDDGDDFIDDVSRYYDVMDDDVTIDLLGKGDKKKKVVEEDDEEEGENITKPFIPTNNNNDVSRKMIEPENVKSESIGHSIVVHNLRYVFDEKEVRKIFYDFKDFKVKQLLNGRNLPTGDWEVSFRSENDMRRALSICSSLIVRGQRVFANEHKKVCPSLRKVSVKGRKKKTSLLVKVPPASVSGSVYPSEESPFMTSFSTPSTPQFRPRISLPQPAGSGNFSKYDTSVFGDSESNGFVPSSSSGNGVEEFRKRSLSLNTEVASSFLRNVVVPPRAVPTSSTMASLDATSMPSPIGCRSCKCGDGSFVGMSNGSNNNVNGCANVSDMFLFGSLDNTLYDPFPSINGHIFGF